MADGKQYEMAVSDWYAELKQEKVEPPKKEFQVQGSLKYKRDGDPIEYGVTLGYQVTQDAESDDKLAMVFNFKSTDAAKLDPNTQQVSQYLKYRKKGDFSQWRYVMCTTDKDGQKVENFKPFMDDVSAVSSMTERPNAAAGKDAKFWDSKQKDAVEAKGHFFEKSDDTSGSYARVKDNVAEAQCIAELSIPKVDDGSEDFVGEDILGDYDVEVGLNIQQKGQAASTKLTYSDKKTLKMKAPQYADSITEEVQKHKDVHFDRFMESDEVEFDAYAPMKGDASGKPKGTIKLVGENVVNSDPNSTPTVRMTIQSKIPADSLPADNDNNYVYRHTLRLKNQEEYDQEDLVFGCDVDAKDPSRADVKQFDKNYDLQATDRTFKPKGGETVKSESKIGKAPADKKQFKAKKATIDSKEYVETQCVISIEFDDRVKKLAGKIFDKFYEAEIGLQYFDKKAKEAPYSVKVAKLDTEAYLPTPVFKDEFKEKKNTKFFQNGYNMRDASADEVSYRDVAWEWKVAKETNQPDQLRVTFFSTFDKASV